MFSLFSKIGVVLNQCYLICYGLILLFSTIACLEFSEINIFPSGNSWLYSFETSVLLSEKTENAKDVGFLIDGTVVVTSLWENSDMERLLQFEFQSPKLNIRSGKLPTSNGYMAHSSKLDTSTNSPFLVHWSNGKIQKILLRKDEPLSLINLKKGIASIFQFQLEEKELSEIDSSGHCDVKYSTSGTNTFIKTKQLCTSSDFPHYSNSDPVLNTKVESNRIVNYELSTDQSFLKSAKLSEKHLMIMNAKEDVGNKILVHQTLQFSKSFKTDTVIGNSFDEVVNKVIEKESFLYTQESLLTEPEMQSVAEMPTFKSTVKANRANLKANIIGSLESSKVIGKLIEIGKSSTKEDIIKTIGAKKNSVILSQLYDLLGIIQTDVSHQAVMKKLFFDDRKHADNSERYLWSLSVSSQPNPQILDDLISRFKKTDNFPDNVKETLLLTISAMAYKLSNLPNFDKYFTIYEKAEEIILNGLLYSKDEERYTYLRALKNLKSNTTIPKILEILKTGSDKECVLAWKAVASFHPSQWNDELLSTATTTFFQMDRKYDSSSRTLALDILLGANPSDNLIHRLIYFLTSNCKSFEVFQYLMQKLNMISESNLNFKNKVQKIIRSDPKLNNYFILSEKGLSTVLKRTFLENSEGNATLIAVQEIKSGIVKRGIVDVILEKSTIDQELFRLGMFTTGLSSLISNDEADSDETTTAGIELSILGVQIRPFMFFNGQSELMGHVWSGTASEMTPAYQALLLPYNHEQYLRLAPGFICELDLKGAASFDLSGKIEISLWGRNAVSLIKKSAGLFVKGFIRLEASFVKSQVEFIVLMEPKLSLETDINFSSSINLCMRLAQPDFTYRHHIYKSERVPGSKHQIRKSKYFKSIIPGKTFSLNKKNNEMCNKIANNKQ